MSSITHRPSDSGRTRIEVLPAHVTSVDSASGEGPGETEDSLRVLLELRPALLGHAGIPQETRLLFRALTRIGGVRVEGLIQSGALVLARGLPSAAHLRRRMSTDAKINRLSRVVVSVQKELKPRWIERLVAIWEKTVAPAAMLLRHLVGMTQELSYFEPTHFRDFVWRALFAKTLAIEDFASVTQAGYRVARVPWETMNVCALVTKLLGRAIFPRLDTREFDLVIVETPYPGTVSKGTRMLVRYHDAIPLLMPHTISDRYFHQTFHYQALRKNVESGAWFACVSDATRRDLLALFPQLEGRAITIHNMVSHHYFPEDSSQARLPEIIGTRRHSGVKWRSPQKAPLDAKGLESRAPEYLLIVSTIEPRKNHVNLLAAWEKLRVERFFHLKLVVVGALGWDHKPILRRFRPWIERDQLFVLDDVPAPELRLLYRYAQATVCPSFGEGFDFSGVEAMRCGGVVSASDIPVHREVYGEAAQYFNPYSPDEMADAIAGIIDPLQSDRREALVAQGAVVSARYLPERILPQWEKLLHSFRQTPQRACNAASPLAR